jgi:hypothetical protein
MPNFFDEKIQEAFDKALNIIQAHKTVLNGIGLNLKRNEAGLNIVTADDLPEPGEWFTLGTSFLTCGSAQAIILEKNAERIVAYITMAGSTCCHASTTNGLAQITTIYGSLLESFTQEQLKTGATGLYKKGQPRQFTALEDSAYIWTLNAT